MSSSSSSSSSSSNNEQNTRPQNKNTQTKNVYSVKIKNSEQIPIPDNERTCTDFICIIIGVGFTFLMIVFCAFSFDYEKFIKANFPADSDGKLCGVDYPAYPYVYFANPPQISRRVCVSQCPQKGDRQLKCRMTDEVGCRFSNTPGYEVVYYESSNQKNRIGMFCLPKEQSLKQQVLINAHLQKKYLFIKSLDVIKISFITSVVLSLIYLLATQFFPKQMDTIGTFGGIIAVAILGILMLIYNTSGSFKIGSAIAFILLAIILILNFLKNRKTYQLQGIFLKYASKMAKQRPIVFAYIPIFIVFLVLFIILLVLEFTAVWGGGHLVFDRDYSIFYKYQSTKAIIGTILIVIQGIWGLSFLKEAFNFCISGNAVAYYFKRQEQNRPFKNLWCNHLGSVIGGAFMTGFFSLGDYIFDLLKPSDNQQETLQSKCCSMCLCDCLRKTFDLVRSDAMAYINLTGNTYCNSARYCEYLCDQSRILEFSQSLSRTYRLGAHGLIAGISCIVALYINGQVSPISILVIFFLSIFVCTFFVSLHADAAEAMTINFLVEEELLKRHEQQNDKNRKFNRGDLQNLKYLIKQRLTHDDIRINQEIMEEIENNPKLKEIWQ